MSAGIIKGFYGGSHTPCNIFVAELDDNIFIYCVAGSENLNITCEPLEMGVDVETIIDVDTITCDPVDHVYQFMSEIEDCINSGRL
jgi:hypothetical protein